MEFTDRILKCVICGEDFVFSAGEQVFFREKQFQHVPRHCKKCNAKHRNARGRVETCVTCSECGASTTVPFLPHLGQPVLCRSCFQWHRRGAPPPSRPFQFRQLRQVAFGPVLIAPLAFAGDAGAAALLKSNVGS